MQVLTNTTKNWVKTPIVLWTLIATLFMMTGVYVAFQANTASAGSLTSIKDTLSNPLDSTVQASAPGATVQHQFEFTIETGLPTVGGAGDDFEIWIDFPQDEFTINALGTGDISLECNPGCGTRTFQTNTVTLADTGGAATDEQIQIAFEEVTLDDGSDVPASSTLRLTIDAAPGIDNPSKTNPAGEADTHPIDVTTKTTGGTDIDLGTAVVAIVEGVVVSATIDETLAFEIDAVTNANCDTSFTTLAGPDSTETTIPFGDLTSPDSFVHACQDLTISTNASGGYTVTASSDSSLKSVAGDLINNGTCDGTCDLDTSDTWATPTNNGFGYSCSGTDCVISATTDYRTFACRGTAGAGNDCLPNGGETAQGVMTNAGQADAESARIQYKLSFGGTQAAGAYENTITYVATPTF